MYCFTFFSWPEKVRRTYHFLMPLFFAIEESYAMNVGSASLRSR
jgi:hypothetical protein